jgi:hypothetical protein
VDATEEYDQRRCDESDGLAERHDAIGIHEVNLWSIIAPDKMAHRSQAPLKSLDYS